jgi:hypothetical protein
MRGVRCGTGWAIPARVSNLIGWNAGFLVRIRLPSRYRARDRSSRVGHGPYTVLMKLPDVSSRFPMRQCARSGRRKEKLMRRAHGSPSSLATAETRLLGRDSCGHWIVQEPGGQCGGIFLNRAEAVKFALFDEVDHRPRAVILVPGVLELEMLKTTRGRKFAAEQVSATTGAKLRRVA